ncbi:MAG: hypothetical protein CMA62_02735 [Euryarchaeota archaeon]|nr:hypothetical protein [Euryarchaeota archaeon]MBT86420.1 hypothetical protein [Euryarchaeota archaeon]DAC46764.1 MAG TPA: hypothetical protein D7H82_03215 [Candidatus Poseidoniales archaeon]HII33894.1 hypothetical protein [Candidatus Thalassarchaeaceae archaeon]
MIILDEIERRNLVERFLRRCVTYANESIRRKSKRGQSEDEIEKWIIYRDFTLHAAEEVAAGDLDSWLEDGPVDFEPGNQDSES